MFGAEEQIEDQKRSPECSPSPDRTIALSSRSCTDPIVRKKVASGRDVNQATVLSRTQSNTVDQSALLFNL